MRKVRLEVTRKVTGNVVETHEHAGDFKEWVNYSTAFHARQEGSQLFIGANDETLSVAMRIDNPDCSPFSTGK